MSTTAIHKKNGTFVPLNVIAVVLLVACSSCATLPLHVKPPRGNEGVVYLYLQPFPQSADRLTFTLSGVSAVRDDGQEVPLSLRLAELKGKELTRQRLLCQGVLPPGSYTGFSFNTAKASLQAEEGDANLLIPEKPVTMHFRFQVVERKAAIVFLAFNYGQAVQSGFSFTPAFFAFSPPKPVTAVLGYVLNTESDDMTVFDKNAMQAVGAVAAGREPKGIALDQRQKRVYAAMAGDNDVEVIDITTQDTLNRIRLNLGDEPQGLALSPDGRTLLAVNAGSNTVSVIDTALLLETARIPVGNGPNAILMDRTGRRAYVFNTLNDTVSVIDVPNRALVTSFSTDPAPLWGQFNAKGDRLYIIHGQSAYMTVFDTLGMKVLSRVFVGLGMSALKVDPVTDLIYAGRRNDAGVEIYDPASLVAFDYIATGEGPAYMTIDGEGNNLWIVGSRTGKLIIVNLVSKKIVSEINVGDGPSWLTMMGER